LHALLAKLRSAVDERVDHDAARERLVGVERDLEAPAQLARDLAPVVLGGNHLAVTARGLERPRACRESVLREQRRREARAGGSAWMEGLRHGAELLAHADGLRGGDADGPSG